MEGWDGSERNPGDDSMRTSIGLAVHVLLLTAALLVACGGEEPSSPTDPVPQSAAPNQRTPGWKSARHVAESSVPTIDYPLEGSVFPPDFTPPTFVWHDNTDGVEAWKATVEFADGGVPGGAGVVSRAG